MGAPINLAVPKVMGHDVATGYARAKKPFKLGECIQLSESRGTARQASTWRSAHLKPFDHFVLCTAWVFVLREAPQDSHLSLVTRAMNAGSNEHVVFGP